MSIDNPLGEKTVYPDSYDASLLYPIPRELSREPLGLKDDLPFDGNDLWTAYEISWLDKGGKPQVRIGHFIFPCTLPFIIESKSFKLYLNSFNQTCFDSEEQVVETLKKDLLACAGGDISIDLLSLDNIEKNAVEPPEGTCLDNIELPVSTYAPSPSVLTVDEGQQKHEVLYSHLLKTNCPVTGQPDWATVFVEYEGASIDPQSLLAYLISFRNHQDYHENSVESLFVDIKRECKTTYLAVYARYTRRGGLDINPFRSDFPEGESELEGKILRTARQ